MDPNCYIVIYRTILFYLVLLVVFKLMGKREIGQLTLLDLVVSVLMAEIAAMAIDTLNRPVHEVLIAIGLLGALQFGSAFVTMRFKKVRELVDGKPSILIFNGKVDIDEMRRQRYTFDDLMLQLRANSISSIFDVEYAILESNGQLSAFKRGDATFCPLPIITSGGLEYQNLILINKDENWVLTELKNQEIDSIKKVYYAAYDGTQLRCITRMSVDAEKTVN